MHDGSMTPHERSGRREQAPQPSPRQRRGFSWLVAFLLLSVLAINYIDRQTLSVLVPFLPGHLKMSNIAYAHITSVFLLAYALAMPLAGWFVDRIGTRRGLAIMVVFWSLFEFLCGTARSVFALGIYRFMLGLAEAAVFPALTKTAAEHATPQGRAALIGIAIFGAGIGTTLTPPVAVYLSIHLSWSWAFYATGVAGFLWTIFWLLSYRPRANLAVPAQSSEANVPWITLLRDKRVIGLTLAQTFSGSLWWFYLFWIPSFLSHARGLNLHEMGIYGWIPYFFASIGSIVGGYASGHFVRQGWEPVRARRTIMWISACIVPFTSFVVKVSGVAAVLAILAIATFFMEAFFANLFALPTDIFPPGRVASVVGLNVMCNSFAAIAVMQFIGHVVERFSYTPVFVMVAFFLPAGALSIQWLVTGKQELPVHAAPEIMSK
jgi:ACS family hexuronate transporter-like MFS transporter